MRLLDEHSLEAIGKRDVGDQCRGDVDPETDSKPQRFPALELLDASLENEVRHRAAQAVRFAHRHEGVRRQQPADRMVPAQQRLDGRDVPVLSAKRRMIG